MGVLGRRRGRIYEELRRCKAVRPECVVVVVDRAENSGLSHIPVERIVKISKEYMVLDNGTIIPLHRVVKIVEGGEKA